MSVTDTMKSWSVCETIIAIMGLVLAVAASYVV
jgi:H+/gluconate symporter-like permease